MMAMLMLFSCNQEKNKTENKSLINDSTRIISLSGSITETLCELGLENKIVGVDITSNYPESIQKLPKSGHTRDVSSSEGVISLKPTLILGFKENIKPEILEQFKAANVNVILFQQPYGIDDTKKLIRTIADTLQLSDKAENIVATIDTDMAGIVLPEAKPKVLFIYARGAGSMMVAGQKTAPNTMIELSGGTNAVAGFEDFKPLTSEALVAANPDVILMFTSGLQSLGGMDGLLQVQGVSETNAGRNKKVIEMDGQLLAGFGPRVGKGVAELSKQLNIVQASVIH